MKETGESQAERQPLSPSQLAIWAFSALEPRSGAYNVPLVMDLQGPVDPAVLLETLAALPAHHEALRTGFLVDERGVPYRVVSQTSALQVRRVPSRPDQWLDACRAFVARPLSLATPPLARARIYEVDSHRQVVALAVHHLAADGWSMSVLADEILAALGGNSQQNPKPVVDYSDFVAWQQEWAGSPAAARAIDYWQAELAGYSGMGLADVGDGSQLSGVVEVVDADIDLESTSSILAMARRHEASPFVWLLARYAQALSRIADRDDVAVAILTAGRPSATFAKCVGCFVNLLPVRIRLDQRTSLEASKNALSRGFAHEALPLASLQQALRDAGRSMPRMETCFAFGAPARPRRQPPQLRVDLPYLGSRTCLYDVDVDVWQTPNGLNIRFSFRPERISAARVAQLRDAFLDSLTVVEDRVESTEGPCGCPN